MSKILLDGIVGARPNFMKMAPLARAIANDGTFNLRLIHTGQHYDEYMSQIFFSELGIDQPKYNLQVGSGTQAVQTARIMESYESILQNDGKPSGVIVVGDVTSTLACSLVAAKLNIPVAHVEAGLRSGDRTMPEEVNRIVTDSLANLLFVSDPQGMIHLSREGHPPENIRFVGNIMMDTLFRELPEAERSTILSELHISEGEYVYLTLHRPSNVDNPEVLKNLINTFITISKDIPIIFAVHPRTRANLSSFGIDMDRADGIKLIQPLGYRDNLRMIQCAKAVLTDSGGIQEESSVLNVPCLTLRNNTERPVTVELGSSELVGNDNERILEAWRVAYTGKWKQTSQIPLWDGHTGCRIVRDLKKAWC